MSKGASTCLFLVRVAERDAARAVELLFQAGYAGLVEQEAGDAVVLTANAEDAETEAAFVHACTAAGIRFEASYQTSNDDWRLAWTHHLRPVQVTEHLRLVPSAAPPEPEPDALYLEPTLAFGFGEHATTRMALRWLERCAPGQRVLDFGCGTGVLALAAARFGAVSAVGVDIDGPSVEAATANARANRLSELCDFSSSRLSALGQDFGVVVANVDAITLAHAAGDLCARLCTPGYIAVTGLLEEQCQEVRAAFQRCGKALRTVESEAEWCLLASSG